MEVWKACKRRAQMQCQRIIKRNTKWIAQALTTQSVEFRTHTQKPQLKQKHTIHTPYDIFHHTPESTWQMCVEVSQLRDKSSLVDTHDDDIHSRWEFRSRLINYWMLDALERRPTPNATTELPLQTGCSSSCQLPCAKSGFFDWSFLTSDRKWFAYGLYIFKVISIAFYLQPPFRE